MKKQIAIILTLLFSLVSSGCSKVEQLDEKMIIYGLGIDRENEDFILTAQEFSATGSNSKEEGVELISSKGKSLMEAFTDLSLQTGKNPMYSQNLILLIGEEAAYRGVSEILDFFVRYYESRPSVELIIAKGKSREIFEFKKGDKLVMAKDIDLIAGSEKLNSKVMPSALFQFVGNLKNITSDASTFAISIQNDSTKKKLVADGTAIFKGDKLAGFINSEITKGSMLINNRVKDCVEVVDVEGIGKVTYNLDRSKSKIKFSFIDGRPNYHIDIKVSSSIYEIDRDIKGNMDGSAFEIMKVALENDLKDLIKKTIDVIIYGYGSDIFDLGKITLKSDKNYFRSVENNWEQAMKNSNYNINVKVNIENTGQGIE